MIDQIYSQKSFMSFCVRFNQKLGRYPVKQNFCKAIHSLKKRYSWVQMTQFQIFAQFFELKAMRFKSVESLDKIENNFVVVSFCFETIWRLQAECLLV